MDAGITVPNGTELLSAADAARLLGLSVDMVRVLAREGRLPAAVTTSRGVRLFRRQDVADLAAARAGHPVRRHVVQFYDGEDFLIESVARHIGEGLRAGAGGLVVATPAHHRQLARRLAAEDISVEAARRAGCLVMLDAHDALAALHAGDALVEDRFRETIGGAMDHVKSKGAIRVFGEMVDLLWRDGRRDDALALEEMWNRLARERPLALLCAYRMAEFPAAGDAAGFDRVCASHTAARPTERVEAAHLARLEQRSRALDHELARGRS